MSEDIPLVFFEGGSFLVWKADDVKKLRENAGVVGEPVMTSPWYPRQNTHLSLPFEFTPYEIKWCIDNGKCRLVKPIFKNEISQTFTEPPKFSPKIQQIHDESEFEIEPVDAPEVDNFKYQVFCLLKEKGFCVGDGTQYSCDFTVYKSEPWNCHSSALVWCEVGKFDTRKLIQHVRIADSTKKHAIAAIASGSSVSFIELSRFKLPTDTPVD